MKTQSEFQKKLLEVKSELPHDCSLLIVSKTRPLEDIQAYYNLGHRDFGENRVQDLAERSEALKESCPEIRWHMIGHLQSNKVNNLFQVHNLFAIHSVDTRELADKLIKSEDKLAQAVHIFLQFNTSREDEKSGFVTYTELLETAELFNNTKKLKLTGLMTMGKLRSENFEADARRCFEELQVEKEKLQSDLGFKLKTSMGMSQDYKLAILEKSNWVRLGTTMFV